MTKENSTLKNSMAETQTKLEAASTREEGLNGEIEKYHKSNEDLFVQNEDLNTELDELRS